MADTMLKPPQAVADNAARGLELRERFGRGGTDVGVKRAEGLKARREVSPEDIRHIASYFARHAVDKQAPGFSDKEKPSAGYIAWLLWGGDEGKSWADKAKAQLDKKGG